MPEHCQIHFLRKRSLHSNQMFPLKPKPDTVLHRFPRRQNPSKTSLFIIGDGSILFQFLTSRRNQNIPLRFLQIFHRLLHSTRPNDLSGLYRECLFTLPPQTPQILRPRILTCFTNIPCHKNRKRMSRINHKLNLFFPNKRFNLPLIHSSNKSLYIITIIQTRFTIFRCHTYESLNL